MSSHWPINHSMVLAAIAAGNRGDFEQAARAWEAVANQAGEMGDLDLEVSAWGASAEEWRKSKQFDVAYRADVHRLQLAEAKASHARLNQPRI